MYAIPIDWSTIVSEVCTPTRMRRGAARHETTRHDTTRHDTTRHDTTRHDTTRHDTTRHDTTRHRHDFTTRHGHGTTTTHTRARDVPITGSCAHATSRSRDLIVKLLIKLFRFDSSSTVSAPSRTLSHSLNATRLLARALDTTTRTLSHPLDTLSHALSHPLATTLAHTSRRTSPRRTQDSVD